MYRKFFGVFTCGLLALLVTGTAYAQESGATLRAKVPFDFSVRGRTLPAGEYEIGPTLDGSGIFMIANLDHKRDRVMFETESADVNRAPQRGEILFEHFGDRYFLSEAFDAGESVGIEALPSRQERDLKREYAGSGGQLGREMVAIMAN